MWKPPTSSCSASTRSNGGRFSSAVAARKNTTNGTTPVATMFQFREAVLGDDDAVGRQRAGHDEHGGDRQAERGLVAHHLGRGPHRAEQRVLRARRPAGEHDAVDGDRRSWPARAGCRSAGRRPAAASCGRRWSTTPLLPSREVAAERDDGRRSRTPARRRGTGASRNTKRSACSGRRSSLKNSLMPSASVCRMPHGPALFGPMRFCMPAITLRSNQTMNMAATSSDHEGDDDLDERRSATCFGRRRRR